MLTHAPFNLPAARLLALCLLGLSLPTRADGPAVLFRDDFTGTSLRPEWRIVGADPDRWALVDNEYLMVVTTDREKAERNKFVYAGPLPEGVVLEVKVQGLPQEQYQAVSLELERDAENGLHLAYTPWGQTIGLETVASPVVAWTKVLRGEASSYHVKPGKLPPDRPLYLRVRRSGIEYQASYSLDGKTWSEVGVHAFIRLDATAGFTAYNGKYSFNGAESPVRFDYFQVSGSR